MARTSVVFETGSEIGWRGVEQLFDKGRWSLRLQFKKRNILYLAPCNESFRACFVLGDRALGAAQTSALPANILQVLEEAKRYPEGTAVRLDVHRRKDVEVVKTLAKIKLHTSRNFP